MARWQENLLLAVISLVAIVNIVGVVIPVWYKKFHNHSISNETEVTRPQCDMSMNIQEGLWQRHCDQKTGKDCVPDFEEWCDNLDYPEVNDFVVTMEIWGDVFVMFAAATLIRSKLISKECKLEMVGAETGLGGVLILVGVLTYAYADSEVGYQTTDLHAGWGLCLATGGMALLVFIYCLCVSVKNSRHISYFPIDNEYASPCVHYRTHINDDDDDLIMP